MPFLFLIARVRSPDGDEKVRVRGDHGSGAASTAYVGAPSARRALHRCNWRGRPKMNVELLIYVAEPLCCSCLHALSHYFVSVLRFRTKCRVNRVHG